MTTTIYGIKACSTMKKAFEWLEGRSVAYEFHDYKKAGVTAAQLSGWCRAAGWQAVLNRAGTTFRKLEGSDKEGMTQDRAISLMVDHPSMIKRPILETDGKIEIGFKPERYAALFGG